MVGGRASDTLRGNGADNVLNGGSGVVSDTIVGGGGNSDTVSYTSRFEPLTITLDDGVANDGAAGEKDVLSGISNVIGGYGNDTISGTDVTGPTSIFASAGRNVLIGGPGNDTLNGLGGNDTLLGYGLANPVLAIDDDVLNGGAGDDLLRGDTYNALIFFRGADVFNGSQGNGESGEHDRIGSDVESIKGGSGSDTLTGNDQANVLDGGAGNDTLDGRLGDDTLIGGAGNDTLRSRDSAHDSDDCGSGGGDRVQADPVDTITGCEQTIAAFRQVQARTLRR